METIQVDYDPEIINYAELLELFLSSHDPTWPSPIRQYASAVMVHDKEQEELARVAIANYGKKRGQSLSTLILPYTGFTRTSGEMEQSSSWRGKRLNSASGKRQR